MSEIATYKYRLKDRRAAKRLRAHAWACNQVWNWCVAQHRDALDRYRAGASSRKWLSPFDLNVQCNGVGRDLGLNQQTVQNVCKQWARNRSVCFRHSYGNKRARGWVPFQQQSRKITPGSITYLGQTYRFFGSKRRPLPEGAKGGYFTEDALGRWWVCFHVEVEAPGSAVGAPVGVDLGLKRFATLSTGEVIQAPQFYRAHEAKLSAAQRAGKSRRVKSVHAKIANRRRDFHHKLSRRLADSHEIIVCGDVSAKAVGRTRLAKSVNDAGWSAFRRMLAYKSAGYREADEAFTTQTCSSCGALPPERPRGTAGLGIRTWDCSACGASHDRDVNAAKNILSFALSAERLAEGSWRVAQ